MERFLAHIIIRATSPLKVGCGDSDLFCDAPVQKDWNNLPMILGTSVAGILRSAIESEDKALADEIFGSKDERDISKQLGSKLIVSNALLVASKKDKVCEELLLNKDSFLKIFENLPVREHVSISHKGTAKEYSKFDEEIVFKGAKFKFSLEFSGSKEKFERVLSVLPAPDIRLGGGSSKGFGEFSVDSIKWGQVRLDSYSSSLNDDVSLNEFINKKTNTNSFVKYELSLVPDNFFIFGSGVGDEESDQTPALEKTIDYEKMALSDEKVVVPASSLKGALSHRTVFHYNKFMLANNGDYQKVGEENEAVREIFGYKKDDSSGKKGRILISDCFKEFCEDMDTKVFDHVSIDRFTGGAIDGALFQEKTIGAKTDSVKFKIKILVKTPQEKDESLEKFQIATNAFENALLDVAQGLLPLGGMTTKGHGFFSGEVMKNGVKMERKNEKK
ncbi:RAMP superfamily CRISPR-associated protein [Campylobacter sp. RM16190]|uniref:RAMP superfamily CRISPR-associated protein n=1 Tax=Campylobacter sp. RM16190 TaxID=1705727 RepID=UPI0014733D99|nr:RAMP superfamily CRISPR-associated protein [Campylobacter sp. RM16190]